MELQIEFTPVVSLIEKARERAIASVNRELISLYWEIGEYVTLKSKSDGWGKSTVKSLSDFIAREYPDLRGFSTQNIWRMKQFYETYVDNEKLSPLVRELSWSHNLLILSKTKSDEEKEFYLTLSIKERYSKRELERQLDSAFFERTILSAENKIASSNVDSKIGNTIRDSYVLEFLNLPDSHREKDLHTAIIANMKKFILEFGKDFIFIGDEYKVEVGNNDYFIDLLFFHRELSCLVAIELKIDDFKPEYLGKMNFYLEALDRDVKKIHENPSVGIILCKSKDKDVVEYALSRNLSPTLIADYQTKLIDKGILQEKLHEIFEDETADTDIQE